MSELQQVFDRVALHLLRQNAQSRDDLLGDGVGCAYRGNGGMKCAVGFLISDAAYKPSLEGGSIADPDVKFALQKSGVDVGRTYAILRNLQNMHDNVPVEGWLGHLECLAELFGLTMPALTNEMLPACEEAPVDAADVPCTLEHA